MIYFSELKNKKIYTEDNIFIGVLDDVVFRFTETPYLTQLVVKPIVEIESNNLFIPFEYVVKLNDRIVIAKKYQTSSLQENELFILRNIIDKQIIDIQGHKVIRVNDVVIQQKDTRSFYITGVDTGILGIARWFHLEKTAQKLLLILGKKLDSSVVSWSHIQPLELSRGKVVLNIHQEGLQKLHPADLADYLETTNLKNILKIVNLLDKEYAAHVIAELNVSYQTSLLRNLGIEKTAAIISLIDPDEAIDILTQFSKKRQEAVMESVSDKKRKELHHLLRFSKTSVGHALTTEFLTVTRSQTAAHVIDMIKKQGDDISFLLYVYVVNEQSQLVGVFSLHDLILQKSETPVFKFMTQNVFVSHLNTSLYIVLRRMIKYKISAFPIVDGQKRIVGIVTIDDVGQLFLHKI